jgi:uncharacterized RDD family membrane protein YckC
MSTSAADNSGALYERKDYLDFGRRFGIVVVDIVVFTILALILSMIVGIILVAGFQMAPEDPRIGGITIIPIIVAGFVYFPVLKASGSGTVGYRVFKAKLVNLKGERASLVKSFLRFCFIIIGPFNWLFDLIWLGGNKHRQTFRDLFCGTYVIRRDAKPVARGRIVHPTYDVFAFNFVCSEVEDPRE